MTPQWVRSSLSAGNGACVEVAFLPDVILVRSSKDPGGPQLRFTPQEWDAFVEGAKLEEFEV